MNVRQVKINETFSIVLKGCPSTGYTWIYKEAPGLKVVATKRNVDDPDVVGSKTTETFYFQAEKSGEYKLIMEQIRPWEKCSNPISSYEEFIYVS